MIYQGGVDHAGQMFYFTDALHDTTFTGGFQEHHQFALFSVFGYIRVRHGRNSVFDFKQNLGPTMYDEAGYMHVTAWRGSPLQEGALARIQG